MTINDMPERVWLLGTRESTTKFNTTGRKLADGNCISWMWTSLARLEDWLQGQPRPAQFEIETRLAFFGLLSTPAVRFIAIAPTGGDNLPDGPLTLDLVTARELVDLHSTAIKANILCENPTWEQVIFEMLERNPSLPPAEVMKRVGAISESTIAQLKAWDSLESVWRALTPKFSKYLPGDALEYVKRSVFSNDAMTIAEAFSKGMESLKIVDGLNKIVVKAWEEFPPLACKTCGETDWTLLSISPNDKSAKWKCSYCQRITYVTRDDVRNREISIRRDPVPKEVQREVWRRDGGKCIACGSQERLEFDHIIPISKGGANTARNIQILCEECNRKKSNKPPGES